jgi:hypothetical protein
MLMIRDAQLLALGEARLAAYSRRLAAKVRAELTGPCEGETAAETVARVGRGVAMAGRYGVESGDGIEVFVKLLVALGEEIDGDRPDAGWVHEIVVDPQWETEHARLAALTDAVVWHLDHPDDAPTAEPAP